MCIKRTNKDLFGCLPVNSTLSLNKLIQYNELNRADDSGDFYNAQDLFKGLFVNTIFVKLFFFNTDFYTHIFSYILISIHLCKAFKPLSLRIVVI